MYSEVFQVLLLASPPPEGNAVQPKKLGRLYLGATTGIIFYGRCPLWGAGLWVVACTGPYGVHSPQTRSYFALGLWLLTREDIENLGLSPDFGTGLGLWTSPANCASTHGWGECMATSLTIHPIISTPRYSPKRGENKDLCTNVHSCIVHDSSKLKWPRWIDFKNCRDYPASWSHETLPLSLCFNFQPVKHP